MAAVTSKAPTTSKAPASIAPEVDAFERELQRLHVELERFLNGGVGAPPVELDAAAGVTLHRLRAKAKLSIDQFRLSALEARLQSLRELFQRRLRDREMGLRPPPRPVARTLDARRGVELSEGIDEAAAGVLYQAMYGESKSVPPDLARFRETLARQVASVREKTGCTAVRIRVVEEDGKPKLKAKPIKA
jgi:hypothetical protein